MNQQAQTPSATARANSPIFAVVSAGEMGAAIGAHLANAQYKVTTCLDGRGAQTTTRAQEANMTIGASLEHIVTGCSVFMSIVPPAVATELATQVAAIAKTSAHPFAFVECNAVSPEHSRELAALFDGSHVQFVDGGIVGSAPTSSARPRLYVSGPVCDALQAVDGIAFDVRHLGAEIGRASGMKMAYAAITKGVNALLATSFLAAERMDLLETLTQELQASQSALFERASANIQRLPADAARWAPEMQEISRTFRDLQLPDGFHEAASQTMRYLAQSQFGHETRRTRDKSRSATETIIAIESNRQQ